MFAKTFGTLLRFAMVLALPSNIWSRNSQESNDLEGARVTISVFNDADVPRDVLGRAEADASGVFQRAGIEVHWLNCKVPAASLAESRACPVAAFPEHLHLRIVRKARSLKGETMGISFQGEDGRGCVADLFYKPMEDLHNSDGTDVASLLGHVAAHEIGHLLLGTNSHAAAGIMHAHWTSDELASAKVRSLVFLDKEARQMRAKLLRASHAPGERSPALVARVGD